MSDSSLLNHTDTGVHSNDVVPAEGTACAINTNLLTWQFECHQCNSTFETLVPRGPREEKALRCTICSSSNIERINVLDLEAAFCGG